MYSEKGLSLRWRLQKLPTFWYFSVISFWMTIDRAFYWKILEDFLEVYLQFGFYLVF